MDKLIGIPTFKRPASLARLLDSLVENLPSVGYSVLIVDNDYDKSAEPIVKSYQNRLRIRYEVESTPGVVHVRNRILESAINYAALIFLDDDEWIESNWAQALESAAKQHPTAILAGPVRYVLPPNAPSFIAAGGFFVRPEHEDGERLNSTGTGNSYIPANAIAELAREGFNPKFSRIGGEDTELFRRLVKKNIQIRWVSGAVVFESVPESATNLASITDRYRRTGLVNGILSSADKKLGYRVILTGLRIIVGGAKYYVRRISCKPIRAEDVSILYSGLGHLDSLTNRRRVYYGKDEM